MLTDQNEEQNLEAKPKPSAAAERKMTRAVTDESTLADKEALFAELQERANAVDKVMTKNGPPELDLGSG
jgi:hypothetical protein